MGKTANLFGGAYAGKRVLITGHLGFKGSWLAHWLVLMGAEVYGYSLNQANQTSHAELLQSNIDSHIGDITDHYALEAYFHKAQPEIVFHLAAQALVRDSYDDPRTTYMSNVIGTLNVLEACRKTASVKAAVNVTSDKCYENKEWAWGYRENDPMGGYDPYSASKGCAELLASSYRNSYLKTEGQFLLASARAGNVIGGGDWAKDRLIPDIVRASAKGESVKIRNPKATRPWQHVLEPLSGYLMVGWQLLEGRSEFADGWNLGPDLSSNLTVGDIVERSKIYWDLVNVEIAEDPNCVHEAHLLMLDCSKAQKQLHWKPVWGIEPTLEYTIGWYRGFYENNQINTERDIYKYIADARKSNLRWATALVSETAPF